MTQNSAQLINKGQKIEKEKLNLRAFIFYSFIFQPRKSD